VGGEAAVHKNGVRHLDGRAAQMDVLRGHILRAQRHKDPAAQRVQQVQLHKQRVQPDHEASRE